MEAAFCVRVALLNTEHNFKYLQFKTSVHTEIMLEWAMLLLWGFLGGGGAVFYFYSIISSSLYCAVS